MVRLRQDNPSDDHGELLNVMLTPYNVDDRQPVPQMARTLFGKSLADKGSISQQLFEELLRTFHVHFITGVRSNMKTS